MSIDLDHLATELNDAIYDWLVVQPWFDADLGDIDRVTILSLEPLSRDWPVMVWAPLDVEIRGESMMIQTIIGLAPEVPHAVPNEAILGHIPLATGGLMAFDALSDPALAAALVDVVVAAASPGTASPRVSGSYGGKGPIVRHSRWVSVIDAGSQWELAVYRRIESSSRPDVVLPTAAAEAGAEHVRPPALTWRRGDRDVAALRRSTRRSVDALELVTQSVTTLLDRRCQPRDNKYDVADTMTELGRALAEVHVALSGALGVSASNGDDIAETLIAGLPGDLDDDAADAMAAAYRRLGYADDLGLSIVVHGNLSLQSARRLRQRWILVDFGIESGLARSVESASQRRSSPLFDLAGLLHGLHLTAHQAFRERTVAGRDAGELVADWTPELEVARAEDRELKVLAEAWEERAADALISGYTSNDAVHRLLPVERISRDALLTLFELDLSLQDEVRRARRRGGALRISTAEIDRLAGAEIGQRW